MNWTKIALIVRPKNEFKNLQNANLFQIKICNYIPMKISRKSGW